MDKLPDKKDPNIRLVIATPEELDSQQLANSVEWKGALSLEAYLRREAWLRNQDLTHGGGFTAWSLVYQPNGASSRLLLCGCETIKKRALICKDGMLKEATCHGVGSVFCPPENRGKGYAGVLMSMLARHLPGWEAEGDENSVFSVLFSDIGKDFYAARGWHPFPSSHVTLHSTAAPPLDIPAVRLLQTEDLKELCELDESLLRSRMLERPNTASTAVALVPDVTTVKWHHAREDFIAEELFKRKINVRGAVTGEPGKRVWCYWTRVWPNPTEGTPKTMHILRLAVEDPEFSDFEAATEEGIDSIRDTYIVDAITALFAAAQVEATKWDMEHVELWNPSSSSLAAAQRLEPGAQVVHREEDSITSLQWYGPGDWQDVDWICNEKYGWC